MWVYRFSVDALMVVKPFILMLHRIAFHLWGHRMVAELPFLPPLNKKQLASIGRVAVLWATLEVSLDRQLRILTDYAIKEGHDEDQNIKIPFGQRLRKWRRVAEIAYEGEELQRIIAIIDQLRPLRDERDKYVHGMWYSIEQLVRLI